RDLDRLDGTRESIRARLANDGSRVGQTAHALFEEERVAGGPLDQESLDVGQRRVGADESVEEFVGASRGKGTHLDLRGVAARPPSPTIPAGSSPGQPAAPTPAV